MQPAGFAELRPESFDAPREVPWRLLFLLFSVCYAIACLATAIAGLNSGASPRLVVGDATGYYAWLRSIALDGDLDFKNDYALLYPPDPVPKEFERFTPAGVVRNKYPTGLAIFEIPGFVAGHLAALTLRSAPDGASAPYQLAVTVWLQVLIVFGFAMLWLALTRLGSDLAVSSILVASGLTATNLVNYAAKEAAMAHGAGAALLCLAFYSTVRARETERQTRWLTVAGACMGLAFISRPTNAAFAPFFLPVLFPLIRNSLRNLASLTIPALGLLAIHVALTSALNGHLAFSGYEDESFTGGLAGMAGTLLSARHGLFVYSPWYLLMIAFCAAATRMPRSRAFAWGSLASFALLWIANGTWWNWWFGSGFGNRAFIESIPILIVPVALWLTELRISRRKLIALASGMAVLTVVNLYLWVGYVLQRYPADGSHTVAQAYFWAKGH